MLVAGHTLWLISIIYIDLFLPLTCSAVIEGKEIWMEDDVNDQGAYISRQQREQLEWGNYRHYLTTSSPNGDITILGIKGFTIPDIAYIVILGIVVLVYFLIKCCTNLLDEEVRANQERTVHPPSENLISHIPLRTRLSTRQSTRGSNSYIPLSSPASSRRSLILLPEGLPDSNILSIGIENPSYFPSSTSVFRQADDIVPPVTTEERRDNDFSQLLDIPPDYESVVKTDSIKNVANGLQKDSDDSALPKYTDLQRKN